MPLYAFGLLFSAWLIWVLPFFLAREEKQKAATVDRRARRGIVMEGLGFALVWAGPHWLTSPALWRVLVAVLFFTVGAALSWTGVGNLGRQWRIDAGLNVDHELIRSGPYAIVRHPIYASMFAMLLGAGFVLAPAWRIAVAVVLFIIGTEIRVRIEDALLESRFGQEFRDYRRGVRAYIPLVR